MDGQALVDSLRLVSRYYDWLAPWLFYWWAGLVMVLCILAVLIPSWTPRPGRDGFRHHRDRVR